jgi:hypothetical protein
LRAKEKEEALRAKNKADREEADRQEALRAKLFNVSSMDTLNRWKTLIHWQSLI